jgi:hypothetical protein
MPTTTIDVTAYGATGNGTTDDSASIVTALSHCTSGCELLFPPPTGAGYKCIATTVFAIPAGTRVTGVAKLHGDWAQDPSVAANQTIGMALIADNSGLLAPQNGYLMDAFGREILLQSPVAFISNGLTTPDGSSLAGMQIISQQFQGIRQVWSDDQWASYAVSDWMALDENGPFTVQSGTLSGGIATITVASGVTWPYPSLLTFKDVILVTSSGTQRGYIRSVSGQTLTVNATGWTVTPASGQQFYIGADLSDNSQILLPNGHIVSCFDSSTGNTTNIRVTVSTDGGRQWTEQTNFPIPGGPSTGGYPVFDTPGTRVASPRMIRSRQVTAPVENLIFLLYCQVTGATTSADYILLKSTDVFGSAAGLTSIDLGTQNIGPSGAVNLINDSNEGTLYETNEPALYVILPFFNSSVISGSQLYQIRLNPNGTPPSPLGQVLIASIPYSSAGAGGGSGSFPDSLRLRTGEYGLFFSGASQATSPAGMGAMYFMASPNGYLNTFTVQRTLWPAVSGYPNGYGTPRPTRLPDGRLVVLFVGLANATSTQIRIIHCYGL